MEYVLFRWQFELVLLRPKQLIHKYLFSKNADVLRIVMPNEIVYVAFNGIYLVIEYSYVTIEYII